MRVFPTRPGATSYEGSVAGEKDTESANVGGMVWHVYDFVRGATKADVGEVV